MLDDLDFEETPQDEGPPPEESSNRTFLLVAAGLGGFMLLAVICMVVYALFLRPRADETTDPAILTREAENAQISQSLTQTAVAAALQPSPTNTAPPTATQPPASPTSGLGAVTNTPGGGEAGPTADPRTATVQALLTQASIAQTQAASNIVTVTATSTAVGTLPDTGLLDDAGLPVLAGLTAMLLVVIFAARRLRAANE